MEKWTTAIVAPTQEVADSDDYVDPWPGSPVSQVIVGPNPWRQLEGKRYERVAVRDPEAFEVEVLRGAYIIARGNWCLHAHPRPSTFFATSVKASA